MASKCGREKHIILYFITDKSHSVFLFLTFFVLIKNFIIFCTLSAVGNRNIFKNTPDTRMGIFGSKIVYIFHF